MWYLMKCCAPINVLSNLIKYCRTNKCTLHTFTLFDQKLCSSISKKKCLEESKTPNKNFE